MTAHRPHRNTVPATLARLAARSALAGAAITLLFGVPALLVNLHAWWACLALAAGLSWVAARRRTHS